MNDHSSYCSSSTAGPPMAAFQGLFLSNTSKGGRKTRRSSAASSHGGQQRPKFNPIDPIEALGLQDEEEEAGQSIVGKHPGDVDDDCHSEITVEMEVDIDAFPGRPPSIASASQTTLFGNLDRNWSPGSRGRRERICFGSFCDIFYNMKQGTEFQLPLPHRAVVDGLWSQVVLPKLLAEEEEEEGAGNGKQIPQLIAHDIWTLLRNKLQYLSDTDENATSESQPSYANTSGRNVKLTHDVYRDYGKKLMVGYDTRQLRYDFGMYLQQALLNGQQPQIVKHYAIATLVPFWLAIETKHNAVQQAASLLHQPSFLSLEWKLLSETENPLQITMRHVHLVQLYLDKISSTTSTDVVIDPADVGSATEKKWQEALGLYQGWHTLLQQEMEIQMEYNPFGGANSSLSGDESNTNKMTASRRSRRRAQQLKKQQVDSLKFLTFGRSLFVLSSSLDSILTQEPGQSPAVSLLWRRQAEYLSESLILLAQVTEVGGDIQQVQLLLSAASFLSLSVLSATLEECDLLADIGADVEYLSRYFQLQQVKDDESDEIKCLQAAKELVERTSPPKTNKSLQLLYLSVSAELLDTYGRWVYDKQQYSEARQPLEEATKVRRQILNLLRDNHQQDSSPFLWWGKSVVAIPTEDEESEDTVMLCRQLCLQPSEPEKTVREMELSLALSLEYAALALHACNLSMAALSWLQESLILKTTHEGKSSLEVARLNEAMAVVYEDILQWDTSLASYRECLRIRMQALGQFEPDEWFLSRRDLFRSILSSLRSMGNAYRMLGDYDNAVGCFWKIATMSRKEWEFLNRTSTQVKFWGFDGHRQMSADLREMPLPRLILDEERYMKLSFNKYSPVVSLKKCAPKENMGHEQENSILFEGAQAYQTILSLFQDKACAGAGRKGMQTTNSNLAQFVALDDLPILLAASYRLGLIHVHFADYRSAISSLERALHSLWALDPNSSDSGSSSEDSSGDEEERGFNRKAQKRKLALRGIFGKEMEIVDDEAVFHALGICRAACGEHDQAVRFLLTSLRCARRIFGVNSIRASEILYDVATSYWHLKDFDKAREFWMTCLKIRDSDAASTMNDSWVKSHPGDNFVDGFTGDVIEAQIQYNLAASLCSMGRYSNVSVLDNLENAKNIFIDRLGGESHIEVANCLFYMALAQFRQAPSYDREQLGKAQGYLSTAFRIYRTVGTIPTAGASGTRMESELLSHNIELQAHLFLVEANIAETTGKLHAAMDKYSLSLRLYRMLEEKQWLVYVASVLNMLGKLTVKMERDADALSYFQEALELRRGCLGRDHDVIGDTLYHMAEIYSRLQEVDTAMQMFHEAIRVKSTSEGRDSPAVALSLLKIASLYAQQGQYEMAMEKLNGSLTIRSHRFSRMGKASEAVSLMSGDLADDYLALSKKETKQENSDDHVKKILQDDMVKEEVGLAIVLHCMGNVHVQLGDRKAAKDCFEQSLRVRTRHPVAEFMTLDSTIQLHAADTLHNLGCLFEVEEDFDSALKYYATALRLKHTQIAVKSTEIKRASEESLVIYQGKDALDSRYLKTEGSISYALTLHRLGTVHNRLDNYELSYACLDATLRIQKQKLGVNHYIVANTLADMGSTLRRMDNKHEMARRCYKEASEIRKLRNRSDADVGHILFHVGKLYDSDNDYTRAVVYYHRAIQAYGHQYVNAVGRRFCQTFLLNNLKQKSAENADTEGIFRMDAVKVRSIEETDDMITSHFAVVSKAIRGASARRVGQLGQDAVLMSLDVNAPDCWISLELYLISMYELMSHMTNEMNERAQGGIGHLLQQLEQVGSDAIVGPVADPTLFKMHYLIQE